MSTDALSLEQAELHIKSLTGSADTNCIFQTFDDSARKRPELTHVASGSLRGFWSMLADWNGRGAGVFVTVNAMRKRKRGKQHFVHARAIFQEDDTGHAPVLPLAPQLVIETSPGKAHRYLITHTENASEWEAVMRRVVSAFGSDPNAKDTARVLRLAGTMHRKDPAHPHLVRIVEASGAPAYTWAEIVAAIPPLDARTLTPTVAAITPTVADEGRNTALTRIAGGMRRQGCEPATIFVALRAHNLAHFDPPLPDAEVQSIARGMKRYDPAPGSALELRGGASGPIPDEENVRRILQNDPALVGLVAFDEFANELQLKRPIPDDESVISERGVPRPWTDGDTVRLQAYIQRHFIPRIGRERIEGVVGMHGRQFAAFHPVRDYLQGVAWDGVERLPTLLAVYFGASARSVAYLGEVGQRFMISAVARIFEPGCQADSAVVLEGAQGTFKSSALRTLAGAAWFSDSLPADLSHKDARDHLRGKWIIELSELAQFKRAEIETVKAFLSRRAEQYRPSYGRHEISFPRQCVFAGSTNESEYLIDTTGNRRFWPVRCGSIDLAALERDRDQLWAEAVVSHRLGERWHLDARAATLASSEAESRLAHDPWTADVLQVVADLRVSADGNDRPDGAGELRPDVAPGEVLHCLTLSAEQRSARNAGRVGRILRDAGWHVGRRDRTRGQLYLRPVGGAADAALGNAQKTASVKL